VDGAVELEHRVAPDDDRISRADGDVARLRAGEEQDLVGRARAGVGGGEEGRLVDVGDEDLGVDPGSAQGGATGRGRGGAGEAPQPRAYGSLRRAAVTGVARAGRSTTGLRWPWARRRCRRGPDPGGRRPASGSPGRPVVAAVASTRVVGGRPPVALGVQLSRPWPCPG